MSESNEKQAGFFGTYFDRDGILRLSRGADISAWITLTIYLVTWLSGFLPTLSQSFGGLGGDKGTGMNFLSTINMFGYNIQQVLPGIFYFFGLQGVSKGLLIFLDMEDNTRRAARPK